MAQHEVIYGSVGPFFYDDTDLNDDGSTMEALYTATGGFNVFTGQVQNPPVLGPDVVRFADMPWPVNPGFVDYTGTGLRVVGGIYQNTGSSTICCIISVLLSA